MQHVSLTSFGLVRGTSRELVEAAAELLAIEARIEAAVIDLTESACEEVAA
jgi:hypothetical protein